MPRIVPVPPDDLGVQVTGKQHPPNVRDEEPCGGAVDLVRFSHERQLGRHKGEEIDERNDRLLRTDAAGPLETLIRNQTEFIWPRLWEKAHHSRRLVEALRCVWVFESDGDVYHRFQDLMATLEAQPN